MHPYQKLTVWHRAHTWARTCYLTTDPLRDFPLRSQIRRAAISVVSNIVEGASSGSQPAFRRFVSIALASAAEVDYQLLFCADLALMPADAVQSLRDELAHICRMLQGLHRALNRKIADP
jgi:four helix bundle protein